ncbi:MAG: DHH family phosphoesterase [Paludibacteraceae bacterium]|nr:DHH family phosphoesterase [Paludibacteraceae bacterium]
MNYTVISDKITPLQLKHAARCICDAQSIAIITHQNPDGDAMGSSLGMRFFLQALGKTNVTNIVPTSFPDFLAWLPGVNEAIQYEQQPEAAVQALREADLVICTDLAEAGRVAALSPILAERFSAYAQSSEGSDSSEGSENSECSENSENSECSPKSSLLIIDHHLSSVCSGHPEQIAFPDSASASELVFRLAWQFARSSRAVVEPLSSHSRAIVGSRPDFSDILTPEFATCIYTGMMTDTGNFSYNSCEPEMYNIVATLLTTGIDKDAIYDRVFNAYSADRMRLIGYCLYHKMKLFPEYHAALITLNRKEMYRFNAKSGDMEGIVNMPLQIKDVYYSVFMREDKIPPHQQEEAKGAKVKAKISFRSQGNRPVNILAREVFRGGGHMNASGGEFFGSVDEAAAKFIETMSRYLQKD